MAAENEFMAAARKKRVQRLKKIILMTLAAFLILPVLLCMILFAEVGKLNKQLKVMDEQLQAMGAQLELLTQAAQSGISAGEGSIPQRGSARDDGAEAAQQPATETDTKTASGSVMTPDGDAGELRRVYLTFDDGPSVNTNEILDILDEYGVKATFFVIGRESEEAIAAYQRIVNEGHTLGMHSYTHVYSQVYASEDAFLTDLHRLQDYLYDLTGVNSVFYRFPGGSSNQVSEVDMELLCRALEAEGLEYFDWNISSQDASGVRLTPEQIVQNCLDGIDTKKDVVILMHDAAGKHTTVEALPMLIEKLQEKEHTVLLPITEDTAPIQHITVNHTETEE